MAAAEEQPAVSVVWGLTLEYHLHVFQFTHGTGDVERVASRQEGESSIRAVVSLSDGRLAVGHVNGMVEVVDKALAACGPQLPPAPAAITSMVELPGRQLAIAHTQGITIAPILGETPAQPHLVWNRDGLSADCHITLLVDGSLVLCSGTVVHVLVPDANGDHGWQYKGSMTCEDSVTAVGATGASRFVTGHWFLVQAQWDLAGWEGTGAPPSSCPGTPVRYGGTSSLLRDGTVAMMSDGFASNLQLFEAASGTALPPLPAKQLPMGRLRELWSGGLWVSPNPQTNALDQGMAKAVRGDASADGELLFFSRFGLLSPTQPSVALEAGTRRWVRSGLIAHRHSRRARKAGGGGKRRAGQPPAGHPVPQRRRSSRKRQ